MSTGAQIETLRFADPPPLKAFFWRIAKRGSKAPREAPPLPPVVATSAEAPVSPQRLDTYCRICGIEARDELPITYPQVLAGGLHGALLTHPGFGLPVLGMVHVENRIEQQRAIRRGEPFALRTTFEGLETVAIGWHLTLRTEVQLTGGDIPWHAITTALIRNPKAQHPPKKTPTPLDPGEPEGTIHSSVIEVPANTGRRYAKVSGDANPIHLYGLTAKLFGFKRAIAHGMWTVARALGEFDRAYSSEPVRFDCAFKTPVFLPGTFRFTAHPENGGHALEVRTADGTKPHVTGWLGSPQ